jgi:hypothetical protein
MQDVKINDVGGSLNGTLHNASHCSKLFVKQKMLLINIIPICYHVINILLHLID